MGARIFKKVVVQRAFDAARGKGGSQAAGSFSQNTLEFGELRYFLVYLRRYHELFSMFDAMDESRDGRVSIGEFTKSLTALSEWGVDISDPEGEGRKDGGRCPVVLCGGPVWWCAVWWCAVCRAVCRSLWRGCVCRALW